MTEHLPECPLLEPCSADHSEHGFCSRQNTICIHCERECICDRLRACEQRVQKIAYAPGLGAGSDEHGQHEIGWIKGYTAALSEVDEKVLRLQTHYSTLDGDTTVNRAEVLWITYCMRGEDQ